MREQEQQNTYSYTDFENQPFYTLAIGAGVFLLPDRYNIHKPKPHNVLDLGSGGGRMIEIAEQDGKILRSDTVVAIDLDVNGLGKIREKFKGRTNRLVVQANVHDLPIPNGWANTILFGNTIHLTDAQKSLLEAGRAAADNAWILIGTAYEKNKAYPNKTAPFWAKATALARRNLKKEGITDFGEQENPLKYSDDELIQYAEDAGFTILTVVEHTANMTRRGVQAIFEYDEYARGANPRVYIDKTKRALVATIPELFERYQDENGTIPRTWVWMVGIKNKKPEAIASAKRIIQEQKQPFDEWMNTSVKMAA